MPIPNPGQSEDQNEFISRCMSEISGEYDQQQALGICYTTWEKENMSSDMEEFKTLPTQDCMEQAKSAGYTDEYIKWACSKPKEVPDDSQQGGVVAQAMARTKFEFKPNAKEKMPDFMARCMSNDMVREKKQDRMNRANFCYRMYQDFYVMSIGRSWK